MTMPTRDRAPVGAPCWADLSTSDVEGSRQFYSELFGWEAGDPSAEFGGYFMFTRDGVPVAGVMGAMGDRRTEDLWKLYLATDDIARTLGTAEAAGAEIVSPMMPVADLGSQAVLVDPTGALVGAWEPNAFVGFTVLNEHGAPSWFELHTRAHARAVDFYRRTFGVGVTVVGDDDAFRYAILVGEGGVDSAGVMDASGFLPEGVPATWSAYWEVDDVVTATALVERLGGSTVMAPHDTPYGTLVACADPAGAQFKLRTSNG